MRLSLLGYGKMGREIETAAQLGGDRVIHRINRANYEQYAPAEWKDSVDVIVDFSAAEWVPDNVQRACEAGLPIVVGTTGWNDRLPQVKQLVERTGGACLFSSNFSIGVQVFFRLVEEAGRICASLNDYEPYVVERHHRQKLDSPSGTALTLKQILMDAGVSEPAESSLRAGFFPGAHEVGFDSPVDTLKLIHTARSRQGFARGVLYACRWIRSRHGFFDFREILFDETG